MEAFSITCTTCKSRLKVRDPGVIGQILACPKCGGMVLVKPPEMADSNAPPETLPAVTSVVDVGALQDTIGDSTFSDVDDLLSDAPPKPKIPPPALISPAPVATVEASVAESEPEGDGTIEPAELPPLDWTAARPWRYWALLAGSLVAGVTLAVAVVVVSIQLFQDDIVATIPVVPEVPAAPVVAPAQEDPPPQARVEPPASAPEQPAQGIASRPPAVDEKPAAPAVSLPPAQPIPPTVAEAPGAPAVPPTGPLAMSDPLRKFGPLLEGATENPLPATEPPAETGGPPLPGAEPASDGPAERPPLPRPPPREVPIAARLADPLPAIDVDGVPLADFLQVMSDLSTIPITLRPDALWFVKASPISPVTLKASNTSIGAALAEALRPLGLETTVVDGGVVVDLARSSPPRTIKFPIMDLTEGEEQQAALLAEWMQALVASASWNDSAAGGKITVDKDALTISQQSTVHAELLALCEKLRVARSITPLTVVRYDASQFQLAPRTSRAAAALATSISLNFSQPTPLVKIAERLGATAKVRILIDWQSLATIGWTTETEATLLAEKLPLAEALTKLLEPMELTYRVVNASTLEVVTPQALAERVELEFHKVADLLADAAQGDRLLERIEAAREAGVLGNAPVPGEIRFDPAGQCILAALPQPQQQALGKLLEQWQAAASPPPAAAALNPLP